jgi:phosphoenolpyruvate carboxykinase (GTP)
MTVWWEGLDKNPPENATEWKGSKVNGKEYTAAGNKLAHPNSRFTAPAVNCPCISKEFENPAGVPVSAIVFGGRRAKTAPLVYQARDWQHGVFIGATMASETTAAAAGAVGVIRRDPMAMKPFVGYNMADYFGHWLEMGKKMDPAKAPKIFHVNWFRQDDEGNFLWPGFGDNMRVLLWILDRCEGKADAVESPIGYLPKEIDTTDLDVSDDVMKELLSVDKEVWLEDVENQKEYFAQFGSRLPKEISEELAKLEANLKK